MKSKLFFLSFFVTNIFLIFFIIYKNSRIIELTFQKQQQEKKKMSLLKEKERLLLVLHDLNKNSSIYNFACQKLGMHKVKDSQIKQISS